MLSGSHGFESKEASLSFFIKRQKSIQVEKSVELSLCTKNEEEIGLMPLKNLLKCLTTKRVPEMKILFYSDAARCRNDFN